MSVINGNIVLLHILLTMLEKYEEIIVLEKITKHCDTEIIIHNNSYWLIIYQSTKVPIKIVTIES